MSSENALAVSISKSSISSQPSAHKTQSLEAVLRSDGKRNSHTKLTISEDRTDTSPHQVLLAALKEKPKNINLNTLKAKQKNINLKGGRFEAGVGKKDQLQSQNRLELPENSLPKLPTKVLIARSGLDRKDVELVMNQASATAEEAINALKEHDLDVVEAIMALNI
ncbi:MAG: hypothetical protein M1821_005879 [Bathelium mastoideum]|nr:MAG: hypothetical protein M1821_005879 [Bathelium mastoideum]